MIEKGNIDGAVGGTDGTEGLVFRVVFPDTLVAEYPYVSAAFVHHVDEHFATVAHHAIPAQCVVAEAVHIAIFPYGPYRAVRVG